jgi:hypothetical protein
MKKNWHSTAADSPIAASQLVAIEFQTIAAAKQLLAQVSHRVGRLLEARRGTPLCQTFAHSIRPCCDNCPSLLSYKRKIISNCSLDVCRHISGFRRTSPAAGIG